jgi:glycosyltransferase involved in cell wall biosynthesis
MRRRTCSRRVLGRLDFVPANRLPGLSIALPAYNEEANVEATVLAAAAAAATVADAHEIVVVDDGSRDATAAVVERLAADDARVRLVRHERNRGYGAAVWTGLRSARLPWVFFTDSDRQFDLAEIADLVAEVGRAPVVVGYRANRNDPWFRRLNGAAWTGLQGVVFGLRVRDVDCAFKLFRRDVLDGIEIESDGAFFSTELLLRLHRRGHAIVEVPVTHHPRIAGAPTGARGKVIAKAFLEMAKFVGRHGLARREPGAR